MRKEASPGVVVTSHDCFAAIAGERLFRNGSLDQAFSVGVTHKVLQVELTAIQRVLLHIVGPLINILIDELNSRMLEHHTHGSRRDVSIADGSRVPRRLALLRLTVLIDVGQA